MTEEQIWQTIGLDLKRAANYLISGLPLKAKYFLDEAESLLPKIIPQKYKKALQFWNKNNPEDLLLTSTLLTHVRE